MSPINGIRRRREQQRAANADRRAVKAAVLAGPAFRQGLDELGDQLNVDRASADQIASRYLDELVTVHSDALPDFNLVLSRIADRRSFKGVIQYDSARLERLRVLNETSSMVMLTAHRSYLDFVVRVPFARRGFPREFRFAGANIDFWPMGRIGRSAGIIFIRRGFRDRLYTYVLRQYVGWLTEQRANFLWALEGGRTRTGKLVPPKAGLLAYVADAYASGRTPDVMLIPATVVYEYLDEVYEYAGYGRGATKSSEGLAFVIRMVRSQRRVPAEAKIHLGIGEPVSLGDFIDRDGDDATGTALADGVTRAATEVCRRIDSATPITSVALILLALLERTGIVLTADELVAELAPTVEYIHTKHLPAAEPGLGDARSVGRALELLSAQGLVSTVGDVRGGTGYSVTLGRHIEAAYYRNSIVHFFAIGSMVELALVRCADADDGRRVQSFWTEIARLRELFEYEFFFPEGAEFDLAVGKEATTRVDGWDTLLERPGGADSVLELVRPYFATRALAPFLEAYRIVAIELLRLGAEPVFDDAAFKLGCRARAELDLALGRLLRPDAASMNMFDIPLKAADASGLLRGGVGSGRREFFSLTGAFVDALAELEPESDVETRFHAARSPGD